MLATMSFDEIVDLTATEAPFYYYFSSTIVPKTIFRAFENVGLRRATNTSTINHRHAYTWYMTISESYFIVLDFKLEAEVRWPPLCLIYYVFFFILAVFLLNTGSRMRQVCLSTNPLCLSG